METQYGEANVSPGSSNLLPLQRSAISGFHLFQVFCQAGLFKVLYFRAKAALLAT